MAKHSTRLLKCPVCGIEMERETRYKTCGDKTCANKVKYLPIATDLVPESESMVEDTDGKLFTFQKTRIHTQQELIERTGLDMDVWELYRFEAKAHQMGSKDNDGNSVVTQLWNVAGRFRRKPEMAFVKAEIERLKDQAIATCTPFFTFSSHISRPDEHLLEIPIADLHIGKLAQSRETGWEDYDSSIAIKLARSCLEETLRRTSGYSVSRILLPIGNDLMHVDNRSMKTTGGTQMDSDTRYHKLFEQAYELLMEQILLCRQIAPVDVIVVPGNHDQHAAWHLGHSLQVALAKANGITVDNVPTSRKYYKFGRVGLMLTHKPRTGNSGGLPLLFAREAKQLYCETDHHEIHTGHLHTKKVQEFAGIIHRELSSLCAPDFYHSDHGFVGNKRCVESFIFHKDEGLHGICNYTVPEGR